MTLTTLQTEIDKAEKSLDALRTRTDEMHRDLRDGAMALLGETVKKTDLRDAIHDTLLTKNNLNNALSNTQFGQSALTKKQSQRDHCWQRLEQDAPNQGDQAQGDGSRSVVAGCRSREQRGRSDQPVDLGPDGAYDEHPARCLRREELGTSGADHRDRSEAK